MLKVNDLKSQLKTAFSKIVCPAIEACLLESYPTNSDVGKECAKKFADSFDKFVSEQLASSIANAIDYYVKNADITGTLITTGSPTVHHVRIMPPVSPIVGGKMINTLGIK